MDSGGVLTCIASSGSIQSEEGESLNFVHWAATPRKFAFTLYQQIREVKAPSETEMEGDLEPHHRWGRAIKTYENIYSGDGLGNMTMLFKYLLLCKLKMSTSWEKATERR